jgi:SAM-dependent methyltransferase
MWADYNRETWDEMVQRNAEFTQPASDEQIAQARQGYWQLFLTPGRPVPRTWFPALQGKDVLCLAAGGGMHGPILAAAGACVTVFDLSPRQLEQDRLIAEREGLAIRTVQGDMSVLSAFSNESFDLIVQPISNLYIPDLTPLWSECYRVLRPDGILIGGFMNPIFYIFDRKLMDENGELQVHHPLPYSDLQDLSEGNRQELIENNWPIEWSHTLDEQIGGQLRAGFSITGFYEDHDQRSVLDDYLPIYCATRGVKLFLPLGQ